MKAFAGYVLQFRIDYIKLQNFFSPAAANIKIHILSFANLCNASEGFCFNIFSQLCFNKKYSLLITLQRCVIYTENSLLKRITLIPLI